MGNLPSPEAADSKADGHGLVRIDGPVVTEPRTALLSRPAWGACLALVLCLAWETTPGTEGSRLFSRMPDQLADTNNQAAALEPSEVGEAELDVESKNAPGLSQPEHIELPKASRGPIAEAPSGLPPLPSLDAEDPPVLLEGAEHLGSLFEALGKTLRKEPGAITRIVHFGDSIVVSDYVSGTLRRELQRQFGDAGHGFMLIANAWPSYFHNDVFREASPGWKVSKVVGPLTADGLYGLGGVSFRAPMGARARFGTARTGTFGRAVSRFVLSYLKEPDGGSLEIFLDHKPHSTIDTAGDKQLASYEILTTDGPHELEIVTRGPGFLRVFGIVMERDVPGVVLDAVGIQGARIRFLDQQDDAHWAEVLKWRDPDLLLYHFGANESADGFVYPMQDYRKTMLAVLKQGRRALPDASCLVVGPMDRAVKKDDRILSVRVIPSLVEEQQRVAKLTQCAFFNTYQAMGGRGSMPIWLRRDLAQADMTHPTAVGSQVLGRWIYQALMHAYAAAVDETRPR